MNLPNKEMQTRLRYLINNLKVQTNMVILYLEKQQKIPNDYKDHINGYLIPYVKTYEDDHHANFKGQVVQETLELLNLISNQVSRYNVFHNGKEQEISEQFCKDLIKEIKHFQSEYLDKVATGRSREPVEVRDEPHFTVNI